MAVDTLPQTGERQFRRAERLMGNRFELTVILKDDEEAQACLDEAVAEIKRIEALLTTFSADSQTAAINAAAGLHPVRVDREVFELIARANRISALTQGAFDLSYGSLDTRFWNFDRNMTALPDAATAKHAVRLINYRNIILNNESCTVFLKEPGMRIGFGGIGKGYAAERAKQVLQQRGVANGMVNAAGDLTAWGFEKVGQPWTIGIAAPDGMQHPFSSLQISGKAVATSGNYEKFVCINGKRYSHSIDPKTGFPASGIKSVTIICPNAELADALATPVMVMGVNAGLHLVNQLRDVACIIIDDANKLYTSQNINII